MPIAKEGWLTDHSIDIRAIFRNPASLALIVSVAALGLPVVYFALLYVMTR